jgi:hypothetical protein
VKSHEPVSRNHGLLRAMAVSLMRVSFCSFQCIRCGDTISCIYSNFVWSLLAMVKLEVLWLWLVGRNGGFFIIVRTQLPISESKGVLVHNTVCVHIAQNHVEDDDGRNC